MESREFIENLSQGLTLTKMYECISEGQSVDDVLNVIDGKENWNLRSDGSNKIEIFHWVYPSKNGTDFIQVRFMDGFVVEKLQSGII